MAHRLLHAARVLARRGRGFAGWWRCNRGVSAVEFALLAPVLGFVLIAAIDLGLAISERMALDHAVRAGAQSAIVDQTEAQVVAVMRTTAEPNFALSGTVLPAGVAPATFTALRYCACAPSLGTAVACSTICLGSQPTFIYYRVSGQKTYSGWITPKIAFSRGMQVQVR